LTGSGLWKVMTASCLVVTGIDLFHFYMPIYAHGIGLSASATGVVLATFSAAAFVVRLILPRLIRWLTEGEVLTYSLFIGAVSYMLVPFFNSYEALALISFLFGLGMGCGQPITTMLTFSSSAKGRSGEVLGLRVAVNHLTRVVGPILFGSIGSAFGVFPVFWVNALLLASGGAITRTDATGSNHR
jgi:predicted MFS family arabinose efflux permease